MGGQLMNPITTNDIFSNSFLAMQHGLTKISPLDIIINLSVSFLVAIFIFNVYKKTFQGVLYQRSFNISLVAISMVTTLVIMIISGNLILSLGMVGALSIVRFRTPIKDPIDLVFIFWAITVGIANGVGYFTVSIIGSLVLTIVLLLMTKKTDTEQPYLMVLQLSSSQDAQPILADIKKYLNRFILKSQTITEEQTEITAEIRLKNSDTDFLHMLKKEHPIKKITLISYSSDLAVI
ncbi:MAG: DUF4956 domain-containing protein [Sulfurovum sp.]|nr:MAG: DUF4956 domain-containing protein [Sulfurovum sp.]